MASGITGIVGFRRQESRGVRYHELRFLMPPTRYQKPVNTMNSRIHLIVRGLVQGVFFRSNAVNEARQLGITGWVRNCEDGASVEIIAEGQKSQLEKLLVWAKKGPDGAVVEDTEHEWLEFKAEFKGFTVKY